MKLLRRLFPSSGKDGAAAASDLFDVHHPKTLEALQLPQSVPCSLGDSGAEVREFFLHSPEVQWRYPLGLLPVGQKRFVKWLLGKGRAQHGCSEEEILQFLYATAHDLPRHIALTYRINPEWQTRFPQLSAGGAELIAWLRTEFPKYRPLRKVAALPAFSERIETAGGVNFLGHFCYPSGLQQAALGYKLSLEAAGLLTSCRDVPTGVRTALENREAWLGFERFSVTITNVAPAPHFESRYQRAGLAPRAGVYRIAYWAWELEEIPPEWKALAATVEEVWAPTPFVAAAMRKALSVAVYDMLPGIGIGEIEPLERAKLGVGPGEFVFLFMFDMLSDFDRKNPLAAVRAFRRAFSVDEPARLIIKISRGASEPQKLAALQEEALGANILLIDEQVSRAIAYGYIALADCVVSLHRSEGFGMLLAEAMLLGKPVIATGYSGNTAFMTRENSLLVDYEMTVIRESGPIYKAGNRWAEPSVEQAAACMRQLFDDRAAAQSLAKRGRADAERLLSPAAAGARMKARLDEIAR